MSITPDLHAAGVYQNSFWHGIMGAMSRQATPLRLLGHGCKVVHKSLSTDL